MNKIFFKIASVGFALGLLVHLISLSGIYIGDKVPFVWLLHVGIFVVFIPAIFYLNSNEEMKELKAKRRQNPIRVYKIVFKNAPVAFKIILAFIFVYAMLNFMFFMQQSEGGGPGISGGKYVLENHGTIIRELSQAEYFKFKANELRGFSGHWLIFYSFAMAIFWPENKKTEETI
jgi:hypothetical protein